MRESVFFVKSLSNAKSGFVLGVLNCQRTVHKVLRYAGCPAFKNSALAALTQYTVSHTALYG